MARDKDRWIISEVIRVQKLWRKEAFGADYPSGTYVWLRTDYDERLVIHYGNTGQIKFATYTHWDRDTGEVVSKERITQNKRKRVLELLQAQRGRDGHLYVKVEGYEARVRVGSIFEGIYHSRKPKRKVSA